MGRITTGAVGREAEQRAFLYLRKLGYRPVARNYRSRGGEVDLILLDGGCLVFVEVRYRTTNTYLRPAHTVDRHKQRKIIRTAALFIARHPRFADCTIRFDVVGVEGRGNDGLHHIPDAFRPVDSTC